MSIAKLELNQNKNTVLNIVLLLHAFSVACFIFVCFFLPVSFELKNIKNLVISDATANGIDIGLRVGIVYKLIAAGTVLVLLLYGLFRYLQAKMNFRYLQHDELILFSATGICLAFLQCMGLETITVLKIVQGIFWIRLILLLPVQPLARLTTVWRPQADFALSLILAFLLLFAVFFLWGDHEGIRTKASIIYLLLVLACCGLQLVLYRLPGLTGNRKHLFLLPLGGIPFLAFFATELMLYARQAYGSHLNHKLLFVILCAGFYLIVYTWYFGFRKGKTYAPGKIIRNWFGPAALVAFVLLAFYTPVLQKQTETFEVANPANAVMNLFRFGEWPILDFMSSHLLSEQWYGFLYGALFGFNGQLDFMVYGFLNLVLFYVVLYWFLNRLFSRPLLSVYFILLFPYVYEVFYFSVFLAILPLFFSCNLLERPSPRSFLGLFLLLFAMLLWKMDTGVAGLMASLVYFPILWIAARKKFPWAAFLKAVFYFAIIILAGVLIAVWLRSPELILNHFLTALHYFTANQAHGYRQILDGFVQQFYIYHVLFPLVAVFLAMYIVFTLRRRAAAGLFPEGFILLASLFLFLLFLANLQRGIVRHGFAERGDIIPVSTFFAALVLLIVYWSRAGRAASRFAIFYGSAFFLFILLKFFPLSTDPTLQETALTHNFFQGSNAALHLDGYTGRMEADTLFAHENYTELKSFLDQQLKPEQTFLDFSNTPMLYFYCGRQVPGYFNQNLQNTVDDYLQLELLKQVNPRKVPVVVFANYPRTWNDATDGIPNVMRYYLVAEYIFNNYRPFEVMGNKSIWVARSFQPVSITGKPDTLIAKADSAWMNLLPEYTGQFYNRASGPGKDDLSPVYTCQGKDLQLSDSTLSLALDSAALSLKHCYLDIEFNTRPGSFDPFIMQVLFLDSTKTTVGAFSFVRRDWVSSRYMIRLSNHYFWHHNRALELRIPSAGEIKRISILKDMRIEN